jgi:hypothetical protein
MGCAVWAIARGGMLGILILSETARGRMRAGPPAR